MADRCLGTNRDGTPCSAQPRLGRQHCIWHDPETERDRSQWRQRGGQNKSNGERARKALTRDLRDMAGVKASLLEAIGKVERGEMEPPVLTAMATGARALVAVAGVADFEDQLAEMRREIAELTGRRDAS